MSNDEMTQGTQNGVDRIEFSKNLITKTRERMAEIIAASNTRIADNYLTHLNDAGDKTEVAVEDFDKG